MDVATIIVVVVFLVVPLGYIFPQTLRAIRCAGCQRLLIFDVGEEHDFPIQEVLRGAKNVCFTCRHLHGRK